MSVIQASLRPATQEEVSYAKGGTLWRMVNIPWNLTMRVLGTWELYKNGANILAWQTPLPLRYAHQIKLYCGMAPERNFIRVMPSLFGTWNYIEAETKVLEAFFKENRNGELFDLSISMRMLCKIVKEAFPESGIEENDFIFTCSPEQNKIYHNLVLGLINGPHLKNSIPLIQQEAADTLKKWELRCQQGELINATLETRLFASRVISRLVFGFSEGNESIAESVNFINFYIIKMVLRSVNEEDKQKFKEALEKFKQAVNEVLKNEQAIPLFKESSSSTLTLQQKQAMAFTIFFAGQETVASLLNYMLWSVAKDSALQKQLQSEIDAAPKEKGTSCQGIQDLFFRSIREFPPAYGVARILKVDTCLEYRLNGEDVNRKLILYKGEFLNGYMIKFAEKASLNPEKGSYNQWMPFGGGPHRCPGERLVQTEVYEFFAALFSDYNIETKCNEENAKKGLVTLQLEKDVFVTLTKRVKLRS